MEYNSKKRKRERESYELKNYDKDDIMNNEPLLGSINKEDIFINNESIRKSNNYSLKRNNSKIITPLHNINNNSIKKQEEKSFNYIVHIDLNKRNNLSNNSGPTELSGEYIRVNSISTSKYTFYNALPKILFEQFSKIANIYFLIIAFFQMYKEFQIIKT